jgi:DNA-binding protein YbaB
MGTEMRARIGSMVEEYQATRARLAALNEELTSMTASARSADHTVTATVGPQGELVHLAIDPVRAERLDLKALSGRILEASGLAAAEVRERLRERLLAGLPESLRAAIGSDGVVDVNRLLPADPTDLLRR